MTPQREQDTRRIAETAHPLDNIIWRALSTRQAAFARGTGAARKFVDDVGPLAAFQGPEDAGYEALAELAAGGCTVALFLSTPYQDHKGWSLIAQAPLVQLVRDTGGGIPATAASFAIAELGAADSAEMIELATLTRPGPFGPRTHELGSYFGVRHNGKLVAMAGERMKVPGFTEISAVCTHPDHLGNGYAGALISRVVAGIEARGETAFLHSRADNDRAIAVYERLGFRKRWFGHFAAFRRE